MSALLTVAFLVDWLSSTVRIATPLLFAGLGETYAERAGVLNIHLEGMMLSGAFASVVVTAATGSPWVGVVGGMIGGAILALLHAVATVTFRADQIVSGIALNFVALGLTSFLARKILGEARTDSVTGFQAWSVPVLGDIPFAGEILFQHNVLVYTAYLLVPVSWFVLYRTHFGLAVTGAGEHPQATEAVGLSVRRVRYVNELICGALAGVGGAFLSLGTLRFFVDDMIAGRGFIALAVAIFGRWNPVGALGAALLFGAADALQFRVQVLDVGLNSNALLVLPHVLTIVVLAAAVGRARAPKALGIPF
jgi:ABC-type uncharacterized transport system permease subunit